MSHRSPGLAALVVLCVVSSALAAQDAKARQEESQDLFQRWLETDVVYIISAEERDVFQKLTTDEEKTRFIEQFWRSRDPDPESPENEFRDEHYRRVAYANEKFAAGKPGWKTDRGMIYIKFGPPDRRETNPTGGRVYRSKRELQATDREYAEQHMTALPFEVWEYRYLPSVGQEVAFEFVSKDGSPEYTLALSPEDKDALFFNTGSHLPRMRGRNLGLKIFGGDHLGRVETLAAAQRPLPAQAPQTFVSAQVHFSEMPFSIETAVEAETGLDLSVLIPHSSLSFEKQFGSYRARVDLEIFVRDIRKLVVAHRSDQLETRLTKAELRKQQKGSSAYRHRFPLSPGRYLIEVWIKDVLGGAAAFDRKLVVIPKNETSE